MWGVLRLTTKVWPLVRAPWCGPVFTPRLSHGTTDAPTALRKAFVKRSKDANVNDTVLALSTQNVFNAHYKKGCLVKIDTEPDF